MSFSSPATIRFSQVDAAGILYFSRVFELCHEAYEAALAQAGYPLARLATWDWALPLVHAEADYQSPMRLGDTVTIGVTLERVGTKSLSVAFTITGPLGDHAKVRHVHAAVDKATFAGRVLPGEFVGALAQVLTDPPGTPTAGGA